MRALLITALATLVVTLLAAVFGGTLLASPPPPPYQVIVNPHNPEASAERKFLEDAFLKKVTRWPNDDVIRPVDLPAKSPVRRKFSEEVLNRSVESVKEYWNQRIFSGRDVPPPELDTDADVVAFVLKYDGAVGYVSGSANLNGAKVITVIK